jgi:hypothetical protein
MEAREQDRRLQQQLSRSRHPYRLTEKARAEYDIHVPRDQTFVHFRYIRHAVLPIRIERTNKPGAGLDAEGDSGLQSAALA